MRRSLLLAFFEEAKNGADNLVGGRVAAGANGFVNESFEMRGKGDVQGHDRRLALFAANVNF
jgi:hypothetical protein